MTGQLESALARLVGKQIRDVVPGDGEVIVHFEDGSVCRFFGQVDSASAVDRGGVDEAVRYARNFRGRVSVFR